MNSAGKDKLVTRTECGHESLGYTFILEFNGDVADTLFTVRETRAVIRVRLPGFVHVCRDIVRI